MPDDKASEGVEQKPVQDNPSVESIGPPTPPDRPDSQNAKTVPEESMTSEIHSLEDRLRGAEKWMIGLTGCNCDAAPDRRPSVATTTEL